MRKTYADLHLIPDLNESGSAARILNKASSLGYRVVGVSFWRGVGDEEVLRYRHICYGIGLDFVTRVDLRPKNPAELVRLLRRVRRRFEVVAVVCDVKSVARQAAKDRRVDLLSFPSANFRERFFDRAEAELASNGLASLEIDMKPLLVLEGQARVRLLSSLRKEARIAQAVSIPIVISSGASDELHLRKPLEVTAVASLFDLDEESAIRSVVDNPLAIVRRNREKLSKRFVAPGIKVIREGRDC